MHCAKDFKYKAYILLVVTYVQPLWPLRFPYGIGELPLSLKLHCLGFQASHPIHCPTIVHIRLRVSENKMNSCIPCHEGCPAVLEASCCLQECIKPLYGWVVIQRVFHFHAFDTLLEVPSWEGSRKNPKTPPKKRKGDRSCPSTTPVPFLPECAASHRHSHFSSSLSASCKH